MVLYDIYKVFQNVDGKLQKPFVETSKKVLFVLQNITDFRVIRQLSRI